MLLVLPPNVPHIATLLYTATLQSWTRLSACCRAEEEGRALLVVPPNVLHNWEEEFLKWLPKSPAEAALSALTREKVQVLGEADDYEAIDR